MKYFIVPADFKNSTIDKYDKQNEKYEHSKVIETYGQISVGNTLGSGRAGDLIPRVDLKGLEQYIKYSAQRGIAFNYTLNATCLGNEEFNEDGILEIKRFLDDLYNAGVESLTGCNAVHDGAD